MSQTVFWGAIVSSDSPYVYTVPEDFALVVTQICLEDKGDGNVVSFWTKSTSPPIEEDENGQGQEYSTDDLCVAHLKWGRNEFAKTKLIFSSEEVATFTIKGKGKVHMIGYLTHVGDFEDDEFDYDDDSLEDMEDLENEMRSRISGKNKGDMDIESYDEDVSDEEEDEEEEEEEEEEEKPSVNKKRKSPEEDKSNQQQESNKKQKLDSIKNALKGSPKPQQQQKNQQQKTPQQQKGGNQQQKGGNQQQKTPQSNQKNQQKKTPQSNQQQKKGNNNNKQKTPQSNQKKTPKK